LGLNVCSPEEEAKCKAEFGEYLEWSCKNCEKEKVGAYGNTPLHPWTSHLLFLRRLQKAGYPFGKNDLSFEEWMHLGLVNELLDRKV
jgi:hypothetical protein